MADISRARIVLTALADHAGPLSLEAIVESTKIPRSSTHRILKDFEDNELVERVSSGRGYVLGSGVMIFGLTAHLRLIEQYRRKLVALAQATKANTDLAIFTGRHAIIVDHQSAADHTRQPGRVGARLALHSTSIGKAFLANVNEVERRPLWEIPRKGYTRHTLTRATELNTEIDVIQRLNVAFECEENTSGLSSLATVIEAPTGGRQAIALAMPTFRMRPNMRRALEALHKFNPKVDVEQAEKQFRGRVIHRT